eukprot:TRINITY_DN764_c0_g2_i1.p1 TRINITY_DN764_c0_g2~~TRINITY_DN764_c0_g2_i1.p1  ORF type:complete len:382 (+),score=80.59 TRINITY_DN764_c0_g2_i1:111-1256(+)
MPQFTYSEFVSKFKEACPMPPSEPPPPSPPVLGFSPLAGEEWINVNNVPAPQPPLDDTLNGFQVAPVSFNYNGASIMFYSHADGVRYSVDSVPRPVFREAFFGKDSEGVYLHLSSIGKVVPIPGRNTPEFVRMLVAMFDSKNIKHNLVEERVPTPPPPPSAHESGPGTLISDALDLEKQLMEQAQPPSEKNEGTETSQMLTNLLLAIGEKQQQQQQQQAGPPADTTNGATKSPGPSPIFEDLKKLGLYTPAPETSTATPDEGYPSKTIVKDTNGDTTADSTEKTEAAKTAGSRALQRARQMESLYSYGTAKPEEQVMEITPKESPAERVGGRGGKGDKGGGKRSSRGGKSSHREEYSKHTEKVKVGKVGYQSPATGHRGSY